MHEKQRILHTDALQVSLTMIHTFGSSCKAPDSFVRLEHWKILNIFSWKSTISNFTEIPSIGSRAGTGGQINRPMHWETFWS